MSRALSLLSAVVLACATVLGVTTPAGAAAPAPKVIPIDLLLAGSYTDAAREAITIWNQAVPTIKFVEQNTPAALRVQEYKTTRGTQSHVAPKGLGVGFVYLEVGDAQKYKPSRIVAHELGHMLVLNDYGPGPCSKLMTGGNAGGDCQNDHPDAQEIAEVEAYWATHNLGDPIPWISAG